ncbi:hypothetical protein IMAU10149_01856 [Lactobacillus helveticus]|uniref:hypothetical protein n=1 Tax=Lactobacillus helveticus TaxID=1587 RepID=UPI0015640CBC|nr:hypothetical protein [Lactobacillus helveticus]NRO85264.1 hypothetical protein [Lactobacillus helveticus]
MGLAIDGNEVHGIARGGQAFVSIGNANTDGSINIGGQDYFNKNKMKIKDTRTFQMQIYSSSSSYDQDVTSNLLNCGGYLAMCVISGQGLKILQPIIIPTAPSHSSSFDTDDFNCSLSMTTDNRLICTVQYNNAIGSVYFKLYILSN